MQSCGSDGNKPRLVNGQAPAFRLSIPTEAFENPPVVTG